MVSLRQFTAAANIPRVLSLAAKLFADVGGYNLNGFERHIPRVTTVKNWCQFLPATFVNLQSAITFHQGQFWRNNVTMCRDASSLDGQPVETIGAIQRRGNDVLPPLQWTDPVVSGVLDGMKKPELYLLLSARECPHLRRDTLTTLKGKLTTQTALQIPPATLPTLKRAQLRTECKLLGIEKVPYLKDELVKAIEERLRHHEGYGNINKAVVKTKGGEISKFQRYVLGIPKFTGKDQHSMFDAISEKIDEIDSVRRVLFGTEFPEGSSTLDQFAFTMTDKASVEDCVNQLLSVKSAGARRLAKLSNAMKCLQHALCSFANGVSVYFEQLRELATFRGYEDGTLFAYDLITKIISSESDYEHNRKAMFEAWCHSNEGGGSVIKLPLISQTRSHHNIQNSRHLLFHFDTVKQFFNYLGSENQKGKEISAFFECPHAVNELLVFLLWTEKYFRPMERKYINANVEYLEGAEAFRRSWLSAQNTASQNDTLKVRLLVNGVGGLCPGEGIWRDPARASWMELSAPPPLVQLAIMRASWEHYAAGSQFEWDEETEPECSMVEKYDEWETLFRATETWQEGCDTSFEKTFGSVRQKLSTVDAVLKYETVITEVFESMHWAVTDSQNRVQALLARGELNESRLLAAGISNVPSVNDVSESTFGVLKFVARKIHRGHYETTEAMTTFILNECHDFFMFLRETEPDLYDRCMEHVDQLSMRSLARQRKSTRSVHHEKLMALLLEDFAERQRKSAKKQKKEDDIKENTVRWESPSDMNQSLLDCDDEVARLKAVKDQIRLIKVEVARTKLSDRIKRNVRKSLRFSVGGKPRSCSVLKQSVRGYLKCMNEDEWGPFDIEEERESEKIVRDPHRMRRNFDIEKVVDCADCGAADWDHWACKRCQFYLCDDCFELNRNMVGGERVSLKKRVKRRKGMRNKNHNNNPPSKKRKLDEI